MAKMTEARLRYLTEKYLNGEVGVAEEEFKAVKKKK